MNETMTETPAYDPEQNPFGHASFLADLAEAGGMTFTGSIHFFDETPEGDFLSNFYPAPIVVDVGFGVQTYHSSEHAYAAAKVSSRQIHDQIAAPVDPDETKYLGRLAQRDGHGRPDWDEVKAGIMAKVIAAKFPVDAANPLTQRLLATDLRVLVEGTNWADNIWGVCWSITGEKVEVEGTNWLGVLLMERRGAIRALLALERS